MLVCLCILWIATNAAAASWSDWTNAYEGALNYSCPNNEAVAGVSSEFRYDDYKTIKVRQLTPILSSALRTAIDGGNSIAPTSKRWPARATFRARSRRRRRRRATTSTSRVPVRLTWAASSPSSTRRRRIAFGARIAARDVARVWSTAIRCR